MRYIALVDGKAGAYGVVVPDLPGCTSAGSTTDEALRNAVEAVRLWVEDAIDDGEALPAPRSVEALRADPEIAAALAEGAALAIVPLVLDAGRAVRANLSLDAQAEIIGFVSSWGGASVANSAAADFGCVCSQSPLAISSALILRFSHQAASLPARCSCR